MELFKKRRGARAQQADVGRFALLLVLLVVTIGLLGLVGLPRQEDDLSPFMRVMVTLLAGGMLFATIRVTRVSARHQRWFAVGIGTVTALSVAGFILTSNTFLDDAFPVIWVLLVLSAPVIVLKEVLAADRVTAQTILGSIGVYLLIGIALTFVAIAMDGWGHFFESEPRPTAYVYFAFVTITTLGYGDLTPFTDAARMVSVTAAVSAQMYLVIVVARLVSIWSKPEPLPATTDLRDPSSEAPD